MHKQKVGSFECKKKKLIHFSKPLKIIFHFLLQSIDWSSCIHFEIKERKFVGVQKDIKNLSRISWGNSMKIANFNFDFKENRKQKNKNKIVEK